ncbi:MAG: hypothetical protein IKL84_03140 [Clostridia bacterium]|nr:hypothetical protein [Clostridia bacterium]
MTREALFSAIGEISEEYILDADEEQVRQSSRTKRIGRAVRRIGTLAACLLVICAAAFSGLNWYLGLSGAHEQLLVIKPTVLGDRFAFYGMKQLGEGQTLMLSYQKGELVWERDDLRVWQLKGREDYSELIFEDDKGLQLGFFDGYCVLPAGAELDGNWFYGSLLTPEEWEKIDFSAYTLSDVLHEIYCADSADDIEKIRFSKTDSDNTVVGRSVKVKTVTLRDEEAREQIWNLFLDLIPAEDFSDPVVKLPDTVKPVQVMREVTVTFRNGAELICHYQPAGGEDGGSITQRGKIYGILTVEQNHALIKLAEISFHPTPIPETDPLVGDMTATVGETAVPPAPPTTPTE